ncbi:hypothetical protein HMPREF9413_1195 [Paenibacillus sp. HGF7]|nr:hypothetical protein HMPREF9413_1195 [Paenibacillus sp. HGF7]
MQEEDSETLKTSGSSSLRTSAYKVDRDFNGDFFAVRHHQGLISPVSLLSPDPFMPQKGTLCIVARPSRQNLNNGSGTKKPACINSPVS